MKRREYLTGLAGLGALSATGQVGAEAGAQRLSLSSAITDDTHHPGPPRFAPLGVTFYDRMFTDFSNDHAGGKDRDSFAPRIKGTPNQDADNVDSGTFSWSIKSRPDESTATIEYAPPDDGVEQYDSGEHSVAEFAPDVPGQYVLELDAPDGTHEQLLHIFPEDQGQGGPPRISIEGHYDSDNNEFVLESNPKLAPNSPMSDSDLFVAWLADGRDPLSTEDITAGEGMDSWTARIPKSALDGEKARVHAAPSDTNASGFSDTVVLDPAQEEVEYPNRPPEWIQNGIMYEIFPRSFMGPPKEGEWPLYNSNAHFKGFETKLDYLEEMNVDVIWFTPTVPSESANWKRQNWKQYPDRFKYVGGGPHGYDALSYFQKAEDLTSEYSFPEYKDAPWPWEDGYDPANNIREKARESSMKQFKDFLKAAHDRDIKVCLDFVINHGGRHHPFFQDTIASMSDYRPNGWTYKGIGSYNKNSKYFDWFVRQKPAIKSDGKVVDPAPAATGFAGLRVMPQWNYGNMATREHILAAAQHWAKMGVDAFRCDIAYGVPHDFWKEVRDVVRAENSEFMMLDETIPNDPTFAEDEFDLHFDTADFMASAGHGVVNGGDPMQLFDAVDKRDVEGWPEHALITNATENHDEQRLYKIARDGTRGDPAKAQRAVWAAGVTLPGVPFIYYGQERLITKYGYSRYNYNGKGNDPRGGDVGPGNFKRAFMNWEENGDTVPQDHLQFYKDLTQFYKDTDILKPYADLKRAWFQTDDSVLAFGRSMETDSGTKNVIVLIHFDPGKATVDLLPDASTTDLFSGSDVGVDTEGEAQTVKFETIAVVETGSLFSVGSQVAEFKESAGDDNGPGSYTYPTGDAFSDGAFDMAGVSVHKTADSYQFRVELDGQLENPWNYDSGVSVQHLQFYMHNPDAGSGATKGRKGTNVTFAKPYQYRVVADPQNGVVVEDHKGKEVATGELKPNPVSDSIIVEFPKDALGTGIQSQYIAPLMFGYSPDATGGVMPVKSEAGKTAFGGASNPGNAPRVIDAVVPASSSQSEALSYSADAKATLPYTPLSTPYNIIGRADDPTGDDNGPGNYKYPPKPEGVFYDGAYDLDKIDVEASRSRVRFKCKLAADKVKNPWGLNGMSHQFFQFYVRDLDAGENVPSSTEGREGTKLTFDKPYHYRIVVHGEGLTAVEDANGKPVTSDVNHIVEGDTITFDLPKSAIGGEPAENKIEIAPLLCPYDGFGTGGIRPFAESAGEYTIGTDGKPVKTAPRVMDMITPSGTSQAQALAYTESSKASVPFTPWSDFAGGGGEGGPMKIADPKDDDYGPGTYTYPKKDVFKDGVFDVTQVSVTNKVSEWVFDINIAGPITNPWDYKAGFCLQGFQFYFQDPNAPEDAPKAVKARKGVTSTFQEAYHYRLYVDGNKQFLEDATGNKVSEEASAKANPEKGTITITVPKAPFKTSSFKKLKVAMMEFGHDGFGTGGLRAVAEKAATWKFGGANSDAISNAPKAIELIGPDSVVDQKKALSYSKDSPPSVPLYTGKALVTGKAESKIQAIAAPGPTVFAGMDAKLDASSSKDPKGQKLSFKWKQVSGPSVKLSGADTATPSLTTPTDISKETKLEFKVTVTDPDGNSASATTTVTVKPQSANPAPKVNATLSSGYTQPVKAGETVAINAYDSNDPNGGSLSYKWTQTAGKSVSITGADAAEAFFTAPKVSKKTTLTFKVTVSDGQGKSTTDTVNVTVAAAKTTPTATKTTSTSTTTTDSGTGSGSGPGFGVLSGALGTAGGVAYAAKRLLSGDDAAQPDDVAVEDVSSEDTTDEALVEEEEE